MKKKQKSGWVTKQRQIFDNYVDERVSLTGKFVAKNFISNTDYSGKALLIKDVHFRGKPIDHIWIRESNIESLPDDLTKGSEVAVIGKVYMYFGCFGKHLHTRKYSLKDVSIVYD